MEVWQTSNLRPLRLGEEKKKERRTNDRMKIHMVALLHRATIKKTQDKTTYVREHVQKLLASKVGVVETLLAFDLLIRSRIAHQNTVPLGRQTAKHTESVVPHSSRSHLATGKLGSWSAASSIRASTVHTKFFARKMYQYLRTTAEQRFILSIMSCHLEVLQGRVTFHN